MRLFVNNSCQVNFSLFLLILLSCGFVPLTAAADCHFELPGDWNSDCMVDMEDLAVVSEHWLIDCILLYDPACIPLDLDGDGFDALADCDDNDPNTYPGAVELCDGLDNDCDSMIDEGCDLEVCNGIDDDGDGLCAGGANDGNLCLVPGDCPDGTCQTVDEGDPGGGSSCSTGQPGICAAGTLHCQSGSLMCVQDVFAGPELCDGLDNDCDGMTDEGDPGGGGSCSTGQPGICAAGTLHCQSGSLTCQQNESPQAELCDNLDNDCDGMTDEGNPGGGGSCNTGLLGVCADGIFQCSSGSLQCVPVMFPQPEVCGDGLDNDCDGIVDDGC